MALRTKSVLHDVSDDDGLRVSIMSRHTLDDGITPDPRITPEKYHDHRKEFAPPPRVIGAYRRKEIGWFDFKRIYFDYLRSPIIKPRVRDFARRALDETITVLCLEPSHDMCHRGLFANECARYFPELVVYHDE